MIDLIQKVTLWDMIKQYFMMNRKTPPFILFPAFAVGFIVTWLITQRVSFLFVAALYIAIWLLGAVIVFVISRKEIQLMVLYSRYVERTDMRDDEWFARSREAATVRYGMKEGRIKRIWSWR